MSTISDDRFNKHNLRKTTVAGNKLVQHKGCDRDLEAIARRLLAYRDGVTEVNVASHRLTVWVQRKDCIGFEAPDGLTINQVSVFGDPEERSSDGGAAAITLRWS